MRTLYNPHASRTLDKLSPDRSPLEFHARLPDYAPTPLVDAPGLTDALRVGHVWIKDESSRLGLPAFKVLGVSWAMYQSLKKRLGGDIGLWETLEELKEHLAPLLPLALVAATDGNHGRAVACMARLLGLEARIFVPANMTAARMEAIASEGAEVRVVNGTYDEAVERSAEDANEHRILISDTSWPGYEEVPRWVIDGYSTILWEIDDELARRKQRGPDLVVAQIGVGAFSAAVTRHYRAPGLSSRPAILGVEPVGSACMLASVEAGRIASIPGPHESIMAGLNCGTPSLLAWPIVSSGVDAFVEIEDDWARRAMRSLAEAGLVAGETGAAGLGGLLGLLCSEEEQHARQSLGIDEETRVLVFNCEGATDPASYAQIMASTGDDPPQS